jgi:LysM repeat protein
VLWEIAEKYQLRPETILWVNDVDNPDILLVGQKLLIPPVDGVLYTVQPDERLADIATRYGVELDAVASANGMSNVDSLVAGVDIFLPGARPMRRSASAPTAEPSVVQGPDGEQNAAIVAPPIPLPANIDVLLATSWLSADGQTMLWRDPEQGARQLHALPAGVRLERLEGFKGGRIQVRDPGDGVTRQAMTGWVNAMDLAPGKAPATGQLPVSYPAATAMDIAHVFAPYRSQLDGGPWAEANCGPTAVSMGLAAFGIDVIPGKLRPQVLNAQRMWGNNTGTLITALAEVVQSYGIHALDLYSADGGLYRWSLDDIRTHVRQGHPVVVQVRYRSLPGRGGVAYYGDHYILVTGALPDGSFLYNDPINHDGVGWDRVMSADRLKTAMNASASRYAYTAFALSR